MTKTQTQFAFITGFVLVLTLIIWLTGATDGLWLDQVSQLGKLTGKLAG